MRLLSSLLITGLLLGSVAAHAVTDRSPEARLSRALDGRTAGDPVDCIQQYEIRSSRIIDRTAILYETNDGTLYLNQPRTGASSLGRDDILVTDTHSSQLCSIDVVQLLDSTSRSNTGFVGLGKFVPYKKPKRDGGN